jgi:prepilin-type N-terminal cleavage/methylation domain-containing protein
MRRLHRQDGFTLVEVLLVSVIGLIIFGASMSAFGVLYRNNRADEMQRDNVEDARVALDVAARQLRNLANPSGANPTIARATDKDFIFQTSDPAKTWVRYCLDTSSAGASAAHAKLWMAESSNATLPAGMTSGCPGTGASRTTVVSQNVTNVINGQDRNVFTYTCLSGSAPTCPAGSADYPQITMVAAQLFVDTNPNDKVHEQQVATAVYLRNQNQAPTAVVSGPTRMATYKVMLNGSGSNDPEGRTLDFHWYLDSAPPSPFNCNAPPQDAWSGPVWQKDFTGSAAIGSTHTAWLVVCDPGGLSSTSSPIPVTVPS